MLKNNTYLNILPWTSSWSRWQSQANCSPWSQLEYLWAAGAQVPPRELSHTGLTHPCVCAQRSENTHCWSWILSSYHCAVQSCFIAALTHFCFWSVLSGFLRPQETNCPSCLFLLPWVEMNTWIAGLWSTGDTLPPPAERWTVLGPPPCFYGWKWEVLDSI